MHPRRSRSRSWWSAWWSSLSANEDPSSRTWQLTFGSCWRCERLGPIEPCNHLLSGTTRSRSRSEEVVWPSPARHQLLDPFWIPEPPPTARGAHHATTPHPATPPSAWLRVEGWWSPESLWPRLSPGCPASSWTTPSSQCASAWPRSLECSPGPGWTPPPAWHWSRWKPLGSNALPQLLRTKTRSAQTMPCVQFGLRWRLTCSKHCMSCECDFCRRDSCLLSVTRLRSHSRSMHACNHAQHAAEISNPVWRDARAFSTTHCFHDTLNWRQRFTGEIHACVQSYTACSRLQWSWDANGCKNLFLLGATSKQEWNQVSASSDVSGAAWRLLAYWNCRFKLKELWKCVSKQRMGCIMLLLL